MECRNPLGSYYDPTHVIAGPTRIPHGSDSSIPDPSRIPHTPASIIILNKRWGRIPQDRIPRAPARPWIEYYKGAAVGTATTEVGSAALLSPCACAPALGSPLYSGERNWVRTKMRIPPSRFWAPRCPCSAVSVPSPLHTCCQIVLRSGHSRNQTVANSNTI